MATNNPLGEVSAPNPRTKYISDSTNRIHPHVTKFLFVNEQDDRDPNYTSSATKHAWVKSRSSRMKKERQLKALKSSFRPFPGSQPVQVSNSRVTSLDCRDRQRSQTNEDDRHKPVLGQTIQAGLFEAIPTLPTNTIHSIYFYYHHYQVFAAHASFPLSSKVMSLHLFQQGLVQPVIIETLLFLSAASHAASLKGSNASPYLIESSMQDTLRLRSHALKSLQAHLLNSPEAVSEKTLFTICHLACVESAQANIDAVKAHILGVQRIVNALGGLENLEIRTLSMVYCVDTMKGLVLDSPPIFRISKKYEEWIRSNSICLAADDSCPSQSTLGRRFFNSAWSPGLPGELVSILKGFQLLIPCYEQMVEKGTRQMPAENDCLLYLVHRLYILPYKVTVDPFLEVLCMSLQAYAVARIWAWHGKPCFDNVGRIFRQKIENCYSYLSTTSPDLLFWSLFHACLLTVGFEPYGWFFSKLKECAKRLCIYDSDQALDVLEEFFFVYRLSEEPAKELMSSLFPPKIRKGRDLEFIQYKVG